GAFSSSTGAEGAGVHTRSGNNAGVARTANGNVYAGADGNVYRKTDDGWSKWNNGWQPVNPPNNRTQSNLNSTNRQQNFNANHSTLNNSDYRQLEQDHYARFQGSEGARQWGGGERERSYGGGGGGRFRR